MSDAPVQNEIKVRVSAVARLFNSFDPSPFRERDIDADAETFIIDWAREIPRGAPFTISIELPAEDAASPEAAAIPGALAHHFLMLEQQAASDLRELFRVGRLSAVIGIAVLLVALAASQMTAAMIPNPTLAAAVAESLIILGWVANWRPIEIYLYDWWPIARRRRLYRRIATAPVRVEPR